MITNLPKSKGHECILTVVDRLTKMAHFLPCSKTMDANQLADLMLKQVWKLHGTPKTIVSDRGSVFVSQITKELDRRLGIQLHPSTAYHPRTDRKLEITNKAIEQYLRHFLNYHQDNWVPLLPTAEFAYNNNDNTSTGVLPFKANYGFNPTYGGVPTTNQCIPAVEERIRQIEEVQAELKECVTAAQETMKAQFDRKVRPTPDWKVGDEVWLNSQNILTTRPSPKLDHRWIGPFPILSKVSNSVFKLTLPSSMQGVHPVFHVSVLRKHIPDTSDHQKTQLPDPITVQGKSKWEVEAVLDCRKKRRTVEYLVSWKGFGHEDNTWEPAKNLGNCQQLVDKFNNKYPDAASRHRRRRRK
jgi:hypothetical protein